MSTEPAPLNLVVLISGRGSNLQAILEAIQRGELNARISAVFSNEPSAAGLTLAREAGIDTRVVDKADHPSRSAYDRALLQGIEQYAPDLVVLAGFMRLLGAPFVAHFRDRMINIHPSLLPDFKGLHTHRRALEAGATEHGASVHLVTEELDGGPVIARVRVPVLRGDDADTLAARVLTQEHRLYPQVIDWLAQRRLVCRDGHILFDGATLAEPLELDAASAGDQRREA